jgi:hypothetical protein
MGNIKDILVAIGDHMIDAADPQEAYFTNIPQEATAPYVRWDVVNSMEDADMRVYTSPNEGEEIWINVNVWDLTMAGAVEIHDSICAVLYAADIQPTGWKPTRKPRRETSAPLADVESGLFRMWSRWSLRFCKP